MSFDLHIEQICTHLVVDEVLTLDLSDLKTVRTLRPISNRAVEMKINMFLIEDASDPDVGFKLVRDSLSIDPTARQIEFRKLRRSTDEFYEVTYYTSSANCRRCMGLRVENDYRYNANGGVIAVQDEVKLVQDIKKLVLTAIGSNPFHKWYGTSISEMIGSKISNAGFIRTKMTTDITLALARYKDIQRKQASVQIVTPRERYLRTLDLQVTQDVLEPTAFNVSLAFTNQARTALFVDESIHLPSPESLVYQTPTSDILVNENFGRAG